jgi:hypothetical protein
LPFSTAHLVLIALNLRSGFLEERVSGALKGGTEIATLDEV